MSEPATIPSDSEQARQQADALATADQPQEALRLASRFPEHPWAQAMTRDLTARLSHLESADAFAAFYNEPAPERPWTPPERVPTIHQWMPRWGVMRQHMELHGLTTRVLELGCMDGFSLFNLALTYGAKLHAVGVDVNAEAIAECRTRVPTLGNGAQLTFEAGMVEAYDGPRESFDAVLCLEILEHVQDVEAVLAVAERHVRPGGLVYVSLPMTAPPHTGVREAREHVRLVDRMALLDLLGLSMLGPDNRPFGDGVYGGNREMVWYQQLPVPHGWTHHMGAYRVVR